MQFKLVYLTAALATIASATPTSLTARGQGGQCIPSSSCSTGPVQCCDTTTLLESSVVGGPITTIAIALGLTIPFGTLVGLTCTNVVSGGTWLSAVMTTATIPSSRLVVSQSNSKCNKSSPAYFQSLPSVQPCFQSAALEQVSVPRW
ncbi:hypothetical protein GYMLUDRAFT_242941 [Collybiopsis luxurians FD-317 M1]|uniref:Hydrophobin n=1 Tax=Collybiopsis luxurians FD-317 M1 TaxID=944289 RepID=A0A0D0BEP0_9AGAR|nr:hypothetical protein GYMLUDRAFT_242941 [Collybiopsis luxurians FD-317 M1]